MMQRKQLLGLGTGLMLMAAVSVAFAQPPVNQNNGAYGRGPGMMGYGGMGPGMMGYGPGGGGYGPAMMGPGMMEGYGGMGPGMMGGYGGYGPGMGYGPRGGYSALDPALSDDQRQKMEAISSKLWDEEAKTAIKLHDQMVDMSRLYSAQDPDVKAIEKRYDTISDLRKKMFEQRLHAWKEWREVLTPAQRKQWEKAGPGWGG